MPIGIETLGSFGHHAWDFINDDIGHRIVESTIEKRSMSYLIGMAIQRGNSNCIFEAVVDSRKLDDVYYMQLTFQLYIYLILYPDCDFSLNSK